MLPRHPNALAEIDHVATLGGRSFVADIFGRPLPLAFLHSGGTIAASTRLARAALDFALDNHRPEAPSESRHSGTKRELPHLEHADAITQLRGLFVA